MAIAMQLTQAVMKGNAQQTRAHCLTRVMRLAQVATMLASCQQ